MLDISAFYHDFIKPNLVSRGYTLPERAAFNRLPPSSHSIVALSDVTGLALEMQDKLDNPGVQITVRSKPNRAQEARDLINAIDAIVLDASLRPFTLDERLVLTTGRMGSGPIYFDTDDHNRTLYFVTYWLTIQAF